MTREGANASFFGRLLSLEIAGAVAFRCGCVLRGLHDKIYQAPGHHDCLDDLHPL